jgi:hypothetical protein
MQQDLVDTFLWRVWAFVLTGGAALACSKEHAALHLNILFGVIAS